MALTLTEGEALRLGPSAEASEAHGAVHGFGLEKPPFHYQLHPNCGKQAAAADVQPGHAEHFSKHLQGGRVLAFTGRVPAASVQYSMDGRWQCLDNLFIKRLRRSLKCEAVHLRDITDGFNKPVIDTLLSSGDTENQG